MLNINKIKIKFQIINIIDLIKFLIQYLINILIIALAILFSRWERLFSNEYYLNLWCTILNSRKNRGILWNKRREEEEEEKRRRGEEGRTLLKFRDFIQSEREFMKYFA